MPDEKNPPKKKPSLEKLNYVVNEGIMNPERVKELYGEEYFNKWKAQYNPPTQAGTAAPSTATSSTSASQTSAVGEGTPTQPVQEIQLTSSIVDPKLIDNYYSSGIVNANEQQKNLILSQKRLELAVLNNDLGDVKEAQTLLQQKYNLVKRRDELIEAGNKNISQSEFNKIKKDFEEVVRTIGSIEDEFVEWHNDFANNYNENNKDSRYDWTTSKIIPIAEYNAKSPLTDFSLVESDVEGSGGVDVVSDAGALAKNKLGTFRDTAKSLEYAGYDEWQSWIAQQEYYAQKDVSKTYKNFLDKSVEALNGDPTQIAIAENFQVLEDYTDTILSLAETGLKAGFNYKVDIGEIQSALKNANSNAEKRSVIKKNKKELQALLEDFTASELQQLHETMSPVFSKHDLYFEGDQREAYINYGNEMFENITQVKETYDIVRNQAQVQTLTELKNRVAELHYNEENYNEEEAIEAFLSAFYAEHYYDDLGRARTLNDLQMVFQDVYFDEYQEGSFRAKQRQEAAAKLMEDLPTFITDASKEDDDPILQNFLSSIDTPTNTFRARREARKQRKSTFEKDRGSQFNDPGAPEIETDEGGFSLGLGVEQEFLGYEDGSRGGKWQDYDEPTEASIDTKEMLMSNTLVKIAEYLSSPKTSEDLLVDEEYFKKDPAAFTASLGEMITAVLKNPSKVMQFPDIVDESRVVDRMAGAMEQGRLYNILEGAAEGELKSIRPIIYKAYSDATENLQKSFNSINYNSVFPNSLDGIFISANESGTGDAAITQAIPIKYENVDPKGNYVKSANYNNLVNNLPNLVKAGEVNIVTGPLNQRAYAHNTSNWSKVKSEASYQEMQKLNEESDYVDMAYYPMLGNKSSAAYAFTYKKDNEVIGNFTVYGKKVAFENAGEFMASNFGKHPDLKIMKMRGNIRATTLDDNEFMNNEIHLDTNFNVTWKWEEIVNGTPQKNSYTMRSFNEYNQTIDEIIKEIKLIKQEAKID